MKNLFRMSGNSHKDKRRAHLIVLLFVIAHALTCLLFHNTQIGDGIPLTILTIGMVFALISFYNIHFEVFLGLAFLACFAGFYLGTRGDEYLSGLLPAWGIWLNVSITSVVTALLGLIIIRILQKSAIK